METQRTPDKYADEKVEGGRLAIAQFQGIGKDDVIVTYWGNNGVCERACYLLEKVGEGYNTHLQHIETGRYDSNGVVLNCYDHNYLPSNLMINVPNVQKMLEGMLSE